jgi:hypothetical protein
MAAQRTILPPLVLPADAGFVAITEEQWRRYVAPELSDRHGELETRGAWGLSVRFSALAVSAVWGEHGLMRTLTVYGPRTMHNLRESGYHLEGQVSIGGRKYSAFTSSQLFQLPDGRLLETATIHARIRGAAQ